MSVAKNGMHLWKSMMHDRYRWIKATGQEILGFNDFCHGADPDLDRMVRSYLSRKLSSEDREYRKLLKSIQERYNSYFKGKLAF
jgi:hypothetical protein